jgi:hypothetical protein
MPTVRTSPSTGHSRPSLEQGTYRNASSKSDSSVNTVVLPDFAMAVVSRRRSASRENRIDGVPTRKDTGLEWATPPTFHKTVAALISERVNAETTSQQLGHSSPAITREFYISKPEIAADPLPGRLAGMAWFVSFDHGDTVTPEDLERGGRLEPRQQRQGGTTRTDAVIATVWPKEWNSGSPPKTTPPRGRLPHQLDDRGNWPRTQTELSTIAPRRPTRTSRSGSARTCAAP